MGLCAAKPHAPALEVPQAGGVAKTAELGDRKSPRRSDARPRPGDAAPDGGKDKSKSGKKKRVKSRHARGFEDLKPAPALLEAYVLGPQIGKGHYGRVYSATSKACGLQVAVKLLDRQRSKPHRLELEVRVLRKLRGHPIVVDVLDVFETEDSVQIVFEMCSGGELFERIVAHGAYPEAEAAYVAGQLIEGIVHCHSTGIAHRDLKPENILLKDQHSSEIRIADFGLACQRVKSEMIHTVCGTWAYSAPEVRAIRAPYTRACDIWSFGVILYILLAGYHPFDPTGDAPDDEVSDNVRRLIFDFDDPNWDAVSEAGRNLVRRCLAYEKHRISTDDVLRHPWIRAHCPRGFASSRYHRPASGQARQFASETAAHAAALQPSSAIAVRGQGAVALSPARFAEAAAVLGLECPNLHSGAPSTNGAATSQIAASLASADGEGREATEQHGSGVPDGSERTGSTAAEISEPGSGMTATGGVRPAFPSLTVGPGAPPARPKGAAAAERERRRRSLARVEATSHYGTSAAGSPHHTGGGGATSIGESREISPKSPSTAGAYNLPATPGGIFFTGRDTGLPLSPGLGHGGRSAVVVGRPPSGAAVAFPDGPAPFPAQRAGMSTSTSGRSNAGHACSTVTSSSVSHWEAARPQAGAAPSLPAPAQLAPRDLTTRRRSFAKGPPPPGAPPTAARAAVSSLPSGTPAQHRGVPAAASLGTAADAAPDADTDDVDGPARHSPGALPSFSFGERVSASTRPSVSTSHRRARDSVRRRADSAVQANACAGGSDSRAGCDQSARPASATEPGADDFDRDEIQSRCSSGLDEDDADSGARRRGRRDDATGDRTPGRRERGGPPGLASPMQASGADSMVGADMTSPRGTSEVVRMPRSPADVPDLELETAAAAVAREYAPAEGGSWMQQRAASAQTWAAGPSMPRDTGAAKSALEPFSGAVRRGGSPAASARQFEASVRVSMTGSANAKSRTSERWLSGRQPGSQRIMVAGSGERNVSSVISFGNGSDRAMSAAGSSEAEGSVSVRHSRRPSSRLRLASVVPAPAPVAMA